MAKILVSPALLVKNVSVPVIVKTCWTRPFFPIAHVTAVLTSSGNDYYSQKQLHTLQDQQFSRDNHNNSCILSKINNSQGTTSATATYSPRSTILKGQPQQQLHTLQDQQFPSDNHNNSYILSKINNF